MVSKAETPANSSADNAKLAGAAALLVAGLVAFYWFSGQSLLFRVLGFLVVLALCAGIVYTTNMGRRAVAFFRDARTEVRKVVWPTRAETTQTTLVVIVIVIIVGIFLWLFDSLLASLFRTLTGI